MSALIFTAGWLLAGDIQDYYNPQSDYISSLAAVGAVDPWIMILALVTFGVGVMALGAALANTLRDPLGRAAAGIVTLSGIGVIVTGSMRHDCGVQLPECSLQVSLGQVSGFHAVHDVAAALTFVVAAGAQLFIAHTVYRRPGWRYVWLPSAICGSLTLGLFALMSAPVLVEWTGAIQRGIVAVSCLWVIGLAAHLCRIGPDRHARLRSRVTAELRPPVQLSVPLSHVSR